MAIEEFLRFVSPVQFSKPRFIRQDVELSGVRLKRGDQIVAMLVAAKHNTAIFRQVNKQEVAVHHDALEFADGQIVLLTLLAEGQQATVLQLPAEPKCADDLEKQRRAAYVG